MSLKLSNKSALAASLGRAPGYISAMQRAGYRMQYGTLTTLSHALCWLAAHPDFRACHQYARKTPPPPRPLTDHPAATSDMCGEPALTNG